MKDRKAGWYWVKLDGEWYASQYRPGHVRGGDGVEAPWSFGIMLSLEEIAFEEIGPRIPTPDEPWQCVPMELTQEMDIAAGMLNSPSSAWRVFLRASPKP